MVEFALGPIPRLTGTGADVTERPNTLTIHLMGGLGNQLFQYAFGRRLALANGADLLLDASDYPTTRTADPRKGSRSCSFRSSTSSG